jgi:hypothetical protein
MSIIKFMALVAISSAYWCCVLAVITSDDVHRRRLHAMEAQLMQRLHSSNHSNENLQSELERLGHLQWQLLSSNGKPPPIDRLLGPELDLASFVAGWYQQKTLHIRATDPRRFSHSFNFSHVEPFLRFSAFYHDSDLAVYQQRGFLELWQNGEQKWIPQGMSVAGFMRVFDDGISVVLNAVHNSHIAASSLTLSFQRAFGVAAQCNIYITQPLVGITQEERRSIHAYPPHCDDHGVFILQVSGRKEWTIWDPPVAMGTSRQHLHRCRQRHKLAGARSLVLSAGDLLYLPQGTPHQAKTIAGDDTPSIHINLGLFNEGFVLPWLEGQRQARGREQRREQQPGAYSYLASPAARPWLGHGLKKNTNFPGFKPGSPGDVTDSMGPDDRGSGDGGNARPDAMVDLRWGDAASALHRLLGVTLAVLMQGGVAAWDGAELRRTFLPVHPQDNYNHDSRTAGRNSSSSSSRSTVNSSGTQLLRRLLQLSMSFGGSATGPGAMAAAISNEGWGVMQEAKVRARTNAHDQTGPWLASACDEAAAILSHSGFGKAEEQGGEKRRGKKMKKKKKTTKKKKKRRKKKNKNKNKKNKKKGEGNESKIAKQEASGANQSARCIESAGDAGQLFAGATWGDVVYHALPALIELAAADASKEAATASGGVSASSLLLQSLLRLTGLDHPPVQDMHGRKREWFDAHPLLDHPQQSQILEEVLVRSINATGHRARQALEQLVSSQGAFARHPELQHDAQ